MKVKIKKKYIVIMCTVISCILFVFLLSGFKYFSKEDAVVLYVSNEEVTVREFNRVMQDKKAVVYEYFKSKYSPKEEDFWNKSFNGEVPLDLLKKQVIDECVRIKVQQILAKEKGVLSDISYRTFLKDFEKENNRREKAYKNKEIIYGPIKFKESDYFNYSLSKAVISLKEKLKEKEIIIDDRRLEEYYKLHCDSKYSNGKEIQIGLISLSYLDSFGNEDLNRMEELKKKIFEAKSLLDKGDNFESISTKLNLDGKVNELKFTDETARINDRNIIYQNASKMREGEVSGVIEGNGSFNIIKCISQKSEVKRSFLEEKSKVEIDYIEDMYNNLINELVKVANIEVVRNVLDGIKIS